VCFDSERERTSVLTGSQDGSSLALALRSMYGSIRYPKVSLATRRGCLAYISIGF